MRIQPSAKAKGARKRFARHASNKQNGRGKYQQTGLLVSFWRTSHKQVLERAQPPTLQQGGSPAFIVLLGWTLAAILVSVSSSSCYDFWGLSCRLVRSCRPFDADTRCAAPGARALI